MSKVSSFRNKVNQRACTPQNREATINEVLSELQGPLSKNEKAYVRRYLVDELIGCPGKANIPKQAIFWKGLEERLKLIVEEICDRKSFDKSSLRQVQETIAEVKRLYLDRINQWSAFKTTADASNARGILKNLLSGFLKGVLDCLSSDTSPHLPSTSNKISVVAPDMGFMSSADETFNTTSASLKAKTRPFSSVSAPEPASVSGLALSKFPLAGFMTSGPSQNRVLYHDRSSRNGEQQIDYFNLPTLINIHSAAELTFSPYIPKFRKPA